MEGSDDGFSPAGGAGDLRSNGVARRYAWAAWQAAWQAARQEAIFEDDYIDVGPPQESAFAEWWETAARNQSVDGVHPRQARQEALTDRDVTDDLD